jgi:hypothetical protein
MTPEDSFLSFLSTNVSMAISSQVHRLRLRAEWAVSRSYSCLIWGLVAMRTRSLSVTLAGYYGSPHGFVYTYL